MNDFETLINDLTNVRDRMAGTKLDHPWDENIRRNTVARLDAALSDLRVVACRMREDQPRVTYDPATDQAVPCCYPLGEPDSYAISESCESLDREAEQAQQAAVLAASVLTNPTPETQEAWAEVRESCGINPESVTVTMPDGTSRLLTDEEREQLFGDSESLRAEVVSRTTIEDATVIDRVDGTRTTVRLDGVVMCEHTPITEDLMRRAQVGWVAVNARGDMGKVDRVGKDGFIVDWGDPVGAYYFYLRRGRYGLDDSYRHLDIVSLSPPAVVANVAEVLP